MKYLVWWLLNISLWYPVSIVCDLIKLTGSYHTYCKNEPRTTEEEGIKEKKREEFTQRMMTFLYYHR